MSCGRRGAPCISIHALREEGDSVSSNPFVLSLISIHALREEGDHITSTVKYTAAQISIHALREEGDREAGTVEPLTYQFLSTPSARRATVTGRMPGQEEQFLSTPSARRATRELPCTRPDLRDFYPRPPRGGRPTTARATKRTFYFYPRPPRGGRQQKQRQNLYFQTNYTTFCTNLEDL